MKRLAFLYTHPIQYFAPLLAAITAAGFCDCSVWYCEDTTKGYFDVEFGKKVQWDIPLLDGYRYSFLPNSRLSRLGGFFRLSNLSVSRQLGKGKTDVLVVHGWGYFTAVFAIVRARLAGTSVWLRGENPYRQEKKKSWYNRYMKKLFLQYGLFKLVDKFLYIGEENRKFYEYYGVKKSKLVFCPYCVDNERLQQSAALLSKAAAKAALGIPEMDSVVLFSGKLIAKKRPMDIVNAFYKASVPNSRLLVLGDGELVTEITAFVKQHAIGTIMLAGFKNQTELPGYYGAADLFVLPSGMGETWGLVVNEAMNYRLPLLVADLVGSASDLVKEGENGYVFETGNTDQLAALLQKTMANHDWLAEAGKQSFEIVQSYSYATILQNMERALQES